MKNPTKRQAGTKGTAPNQNGKNGKPISLAGYSFAEVVQKALNTPPPPKHSPKATKQKS